MMDAVMEMEWMRMMRGARTLVVDCASVKPGEQALIITDTKLFKIGQVLAAAIHERNAEPTMAIIMPREMDGQEPPPSVAEAMKQADVIFAPVSKSITHTRAVKEATAAGARILVMTAFTERLMLEGGIEADFRAQRPVCEKLANLFTDADFVRLTTPAGTNLTMNVEGRRGNALTCIVDEPGMFSPVPNIEANVSPLEDTPRACSLWTRAYPTSTLGFLENPSR